MQNKHTSRDILLYIIDSFGQHFAVMISLDRLESQELGKSGNI